MVPDPCEGRQQSLRDSWRPQLYSLVEQVCGGERLLENICAKVKRSQREPPLVNSSLRSTSGMSQHLLSPGPVDTAPSSGRYSQLHTCTHTGHQFSLSYVLHITQIKRRRLWSWVHEHRIKICWVWAQLHWWALWPFNQVIAHWREDSRIPTEVNTLMHQSTWSCHHCARA